AKIPATLEEENRLANHETGERIRHWEGNDDKESVGSDSLQRVHMQVLITTSKFQFVLSAYPAYGAVVVIRIFVTIARSGDGIADGSVSIHLDERRPGGHVQAGVVVKAEV